MNITELYIPIEQYQIQADLYLPEPATTNNQIILMAHGLGGEKSCGLHLFAEAYVKLGYQVCVFDHRGFGQSKGKVKNLVDKNSQIQDWQAVIDYLKNQYALTESQIILWGYSFSGAHVLTLASEKPYKAVISNFPHVDGLASLTLYPKKYLMPATMIALQDLMLAPFNKVKTLPVVAKDRFAILSGEDCYEGYQSLIPAGQPWDNAVPARIVATIGMYRPTTVAHKISCPTLVAGAANDSLIPISATRKLAEKLQNGRYEEYPCGHFDLFHAPYHSQLVQLHQEFLQQLN